MDNDLFTVKVKITLSLVCVHHTNESSFATRSEFNRLNRALIDDHWSDLFTSTFQYAWNDMSFFSATFWSLDYIRLNLPHGVKSLKLPHYNYKCNAYIKHTANIYLLFISYDIERINRYKWYLSSGIIWRSLIRYTLHYEIRSRNIQIAACYVRNVFL